MGQTLSSPMTKKITDTGSNDRFFFVVSEMQGWRISMEDAHAAVLDLDGKPDNSNTFFAVYDGHGGSTVAKFAGQNVHKRLVNEEAYKKGDYGEGLKRAFLGTDEDLLANPAHTRDPSGCTAVAALVTHDNKIYVANAGDSRAVLAVKGQVKPLSFDHKPTSETERSRIAGAGGYIEYGRVNGNLALSRALGDFEFKKNYSLGPESQIITANPDITCHEMSEEDEFLVLACDGIWDCLSSQAVVDFVRYQVSQGTELTDIAANIFEHCLAPDTTSNQGIGCDNMTILIVAITHGRTKEEWYSWIKERVNSGYGYKTPTAVPQLYAQSRVLSFRARREAQEAQARARAEAPVEDNNNNRSLFAGQEEFLRRYGLSVSTISGNGISYMPGGSIMSDDGQLMFGNEDSEEEEEEEESEEEALGSRSFFSKTLGLGRESPDPTKSLRERLEEFEKGEEEETAAGMDEDSDMDAEPPVEEPKPVANGPLSPSKMSTADAKEILEAHQTPVIEIPEPMKA